MPPRDTPSLWLSLAAVALGLALVWWSVRRRKP